MISACLVLIFGLVSCYGDSFDDSNLTPSYEARNHSKNLFECGASSFKEKSCRDTQQHSIIDRIPGLPEKCFAREIGHNYTTEIPASHITNPDDYDPLGYLLCLVDVCTPDECCTDGDNDERRMALFGEEYVSVGIGIFRNFLTIDYSICKDEKVNSPIVSGSHIIFQANHIKFLVQFYHPSMRAKSFSSAKVHLIQNATQTSLDLVLEMGNVTAGSWVVATGRIAGECRQYFFEFKTSSGAVWRYPEHGNLITTYENEDCGLDNVYVKIAIPPPPRQRMQVPSVVYYIFVHLMLMFCVLACSGCIYLLVNYLIVKRRRKEEDIEDLL